jgi:hypothetical protein
MGSDGQTPSSDQAPGRPADANLTVAGLRAFELTPAKITMTVATWGPTVVVPAAGMRRNTADAAARDHVDKPTSSGGGGSPAPATPSGPPPDAVGAAAGAAPGGLSSGVWCELFIVLLALASQQLRRNRIRPVLAGPVGVVSLLQRPG